MNKHRFYIKADKSLHAAMISVFSKMIQRKPEFQIASIECDGSGTYVRSTIAGVTFCIATDKTYEITARWMQHIFRWLP